MLFPVFLKYIILFFLGLGNSLGCSLLPITINQYFDKHRATASGISFSGACLGSFILPPIIEILLNNYGLSRTFLFLSGFILICIPAALLLRKPMFEIERKNPCSYKPEETQNRMSRTNQPLYSIENEYNNSQMLQISNSDICNFSMINEDISENDKILTPRGRSKKLMNGTLLHGYSVPMSYSKHANNDQIVESTNETRKEIPEIQQYNTFNLSSGNVDQYRVSKKVDILGKNIYFSNVNSQQNASHNIYPQILSNNHTFFNKQKNTFGETPSKSYENYNYQSDVNQVDAVLSYNFGVIDSTKQPTFDNVEKQFLNFNPLGQKYSDKVIHTSRNLKDTSHCSLEHSKPLGYPGFQSKTHLDEKSHHFETKTISPLRSLIVICDAMFVLIAVTNAIRMASFVCIVAIIVDFSRDLHIEETNEKYIMMLFSVGDIAGRLGLGWITDRGYMSTPVFTAVCFFGQAVFSAAIVWSNDFVSLATLITIYGFSQAGLIVIFPILIAQFIDDDKQTVAIPSSNFLSGPLCLAITPLVGKYKFLYTLILLN